MTEGSAVKSADRVLDVLELLAETNSPQSFATISKSLRIPKSSLFQLLRNLLGRGYVIQEENSGFYSLGPKLRDLLGKLDAPSLGEIVAPFVEAASRQLNETAAFYLRSDDSMVVISTVSGGQALTYSMHQGDSAPLYAVSAGRAVLANESREELDRYFSELQPEVFTHNTKINPGELRKTVEQAAESGFGYSFEEFTPGVVGLAKAVQKDGVSIGAMNFAIPTVRFDDDRDRQARRILQSTASAIEAALKKVDL